MGGNGRNTQSYYLLVVFIMYLLVYYEYGKIEKPKDGLGNASGLGYHASLSKAEVAVNWFYSQKAGLLLQDVPGMETI